MSYDAVLNTQRGLIVAPAGCGKTQLIIDTLNIAQTKPYLVLTHTTAGVAALKQRLKRLGVPPKNYVVTTLDGWALRLAKFFPTLCPITTTIEQPKFFYPELRKAVGELLRSGNINDIIHSSYSKLLVDEYQDCDLNQHSIIKLLSDILPTVIFGDPMQCIFNFRGIVMPVWTQDVEAYFPTILTLNTPWRWNNAGAPSLGLWILECRKALANREKIDLSSCPKFVNFQNITGVATSDTQIQQNAHYNLMQKYPNESALILGDSARPASRHAYAQHVNGLDVVEPVDLNDVTRAANDFDKMQGLVLVQSILATAASMMTNVDTASTLKRISTIQAGRNRTPPTLVEHTLCLLIQNKSSRGILDAFLQLEAKPGSRIYRQAAFNALKDAIEMSSSSLEMSIFDAATKVRELRRHAGDKRISKRAIGSTLLLKGLECDHVIILDADAMNAQHLYVALSRGAKSITVFARKKLVGN
ncbi:UvrD-helicase domain-containing protein [Morganella morganii]|uniref:UvrD-helicase domain-containing protein n=1 Tax=Morganella morganii TaxID=582 RepID=UPI00331620AB